MKTTLLAIFFALIIFSAVPRGSATGRPAAWRTATEKELQNLLPARAPVEKERIEIELRTASGITNGNGSFVAGVVLITAGYSAEGKYSHYFLTQAPLQIGEIDLAPGNYVFGYRRNNDVLEVTFYDAATGKELGKVSAHIQVRKQKIQSFRISPPNEHSVIELGRFEMPYRLSPR